jgi:AcrR family transcriptional regulator
VESSAPPPRRLRRDAETNRARILAAAAALMAERGLDVGHNEIARAAGVAVGTVYRRFPDRSSLIDALYRDEVAAVVASARTALDIADPWRGLATFMTETVERLATSPGLRQLSTGSAHGHALGDHARSQIAPVVTELLGRAHRAGVIRPDVTERDLALVPIMIGAVIGSARHVDPDLWRRPLVIVLDGLRATDRELLPGPAPDTSQVGKIIGGD